MKKLIAALIVIGGLSSSLFALDSNIRYGVSALLGNNDTKIGCITAASNMFDAQFGIGYSGDTLKYGTATYTQNSMPIWIYLGLKNKFLPKLSFTYGIFADFNSGRVASQTESAAMSNAEYGLSIGLQYELLDNVLFDVKYSPISIESNTTSWAGGQETLSRTQIGREVLLGVSYLL